MKTETIKSENNIDLVKYDNGKFGVIDNTNHDDSGPRYRTQELAEKIYNQFVKEAE